MWLRQVDFYVVTLLNMFELSLASLVVKGTKMACVTMRLELNRYVLRTTILGFIVNTMWRPCMIRMWEKIHFYVLNFLHLNSNFETWNNNLPYLQVWTGWNYSWHESNYQNILWSWKCSHQDHMSHGAKRAHMISLVWLSAKVCRCYLVTPLNRTPILFDWCIVYWRSKNKHHKHTCHKKDRTTSSNCDTILHAQDWTQWREPMCSVKKPTFICFQRP